jgi:uncharacterized protein (DUF2147 family)
VRGRSAWPAGLLCAGALALAAVLALGPGDRALAAEPAGAASAVPGAGGAGSGKADAAAQAILGNWLTQKRDGIVRISRSADGHYQGRIVGGDAPERLDSHNPDPARRSQRLLGLTILRDMHYDGHGRWSGGTIYDPDSGHTYKCRLELRDPDRLRVRGFLGVALLGRSQTWTRYLGRSLQLPVPAARR